jgi:hypothetical protein
MISGLFLPDRTNVHIHILIYIIYLLFDELLSGLQVFWGVSLRLIVVGRMVFKNYPFSLYCSIYWSIKFQ